MPTRYYPRRINPADALLFNGDGKLAGIQSGTSGQQEIFGLDSAGYAAVQALVSEAGKGLKGSGLRTVLFGHSYMDQECISGTNVLEAFSSVGTVAWANILTNKPLQIIKEYGLGGFRLLDMFPYYASGVAPLLPDVLMVSIGHNDLKGLYPSGGSSQPLTQAAADASQTQLQYLIGKMRTWLTTDVGPKTQVFLLAETPPGQDTTGSASSVSAQLAVRFMQWNRAMWQFAREFGNVHYVPTDRATTDPTSTVGKNTLYDYYDQSHPSAIGAFKRGKILAECMRRVLPIHDSQLPWSAADTHKNTAITSSSAPSSDGTTLTVPLSNGTSTLKLVEVGDKFQLQPGAGTTAADKLLVGRYTCLTASTTAITAACTATATASTTMKVGMSRQLFENPLFLTTTGGNAGGFSNSGTVAGTFPLGVDISNLPASWTVTASTVPHTLADTFLGMTVLTLSSAATGARTVAATDPVFLPSHVGKLLVSGTGSALITSVTDCKNAAITTTVAFAGVSLTAGTWFVGSAGYGNWLALAITNASGAAGSFNINMQCSAKSASPGTYDVIRKAHDGVTYQAGVEYKQFTAPSAYNGVELLAYFRPADVATETAGTAVSARDLYRDTTKLTANTTAFGWPSEDFQGSLMTPEYTPSFGAGNFAELVQMRLTFYTSGNCGPFTILIGRAGLWAVDDAVQSGHISLQA